MSEKSAGTVNGYLMLVAGIALLAAVGVLFYFGDSAANSVLIILGVILLIVDILIFTGLFVVNPNDAKVMVLFGSYAGTVRKFGFFWANPFFIKRKFSLRARNLSGQKLKVNDHIGNPIEIAAVIVW
jgi:regulator of protease activity HflC (stomatin/prohibitin superfamily)